MLSTPTVMQISKMWRHFVNLHNKGRVGTNFPFDPDSEW